MSEAKKPAPMVLDPSFLKPAPASGKVAKAPAPASNSSDGPIFDGPTVETPSMGASAAPGVELPVPVTTESPGEKAKASMAEADTAAAADAKEVPKEAKKRKLPGAPLELESIPEKLRKHLDPEQPLPVRIMGAKAMVPMSPTDMVHVVYQAHFDPEAKIAGVAKKTFRGFDDKILDAVLGNKDIAPPVLHLFSKTLQTRPDKLETLLTNSSTPDSAFVLTARKCPDHNVLSIVAGNQTRLLREHDIVKGLSLNEACLRSEIDRAVDFMVREGIFIEDVPAFEDAFGRLGKSEMLEALKNIEVPADVLDPDEAALAAELGVTPEEYLLATDERVAEARREKESSGSDASEEEGKERRKPLTSYPIPVQIKIATMGDHAYALEAVASNNKLIASAGIGNPRIRPADVEKICRQRSLSDVVIRSVCHNKEWTKNHKIQFLLIQHPKTPIAMALRWMVGLRLNELKAVAKSKSVPAAVQVHAKKLMRKKQGR